jgi:hypothetical protein
MKRMLDMNHAGSSLHALSVTTSDTTSVATGVHTNHARSDDPGRLSRLVLDDLKGAIHHSEKHGHSCTRACN